MKPAASMAPNEEPYSTTRRSRRLYQTRCGISCTSGCAARRDRREAYRRQRREGRDRAPVAAVRRRGRRAQGVRVGSTASNTAGVRPSITIRTSCFGTVRQSRARMRSPAYVSLERRRSRAPSAGTTTTST